MSFLNWNSFKYTTIDELKKDFDSIIMNYSRYEPTILLPSQMKYCFMDYVISNLDLPFEFEITFIPTDKMKNPYSLLKHPKVGYISKIVGFGEASNVFDSFEMVRKYDEQRCADIIRFEKDPVPMDVPNVGKIIKCLSPARDLCFSPDLSKSDWDYLIRTSPGYIKYQINDIAVALKKTYLIDEYLIVPSYYNDILIDDAYILVTSREFGNFSSLVNSSSVTYLCKSPVKIGYLDHYKLYNDRVNDLKSSYSHRYGFDDAMKYLKNKMLEYIIEDLDFRYND